MIAQLPRIGLISCASAKLPHAASARELYSPSALFRGQRAYVERSCDRWFVLSAKYGLVEPDSGIAPYEQTLSKAPASERRKWSEDVVRSLLKQLGDIRGVTFECHAGEAYLDSGLIQAIACAGGIVERPAKGMTIGRQLSFYKAANGVEQPVQRSTSRVSDLVASNVSDIAPASPGDSRRAVVDALLEFGAGLNPDQLIAIAPDPQSDKLVRENGFAFLLAVIFDQGIPYERAWRAPVELEQRLGTLDPAFFVANPEAIRSAVAQPPALHRYINNVPRWLVAAAARVLTKYGGDAEQIWGDRPRADALRNRLEEFKGIGQKKAAMAVEILERQRGVKITHLEGSDIAFDVHVRRVFLRSGLANRDHPAEMIEAARQLNPARPGALDYPAWWIGHEWCRPTGPLCTHCPVQSACPQFIDRAGDVR